MNASDIHNFLTGSRLGVLGTVSPEGKPQNALVGYAVTPELEIVFDTVKSSRKYRNLGVNRNCSFVAGWSGEQTVQYEGVATELAPPHLETYLRTYFEVWKDGPARMSWPDIVHFVLKPTWIRYSDFDARPALIFEIDFARDEPGF